MRYISDIFFSLPSLFFYNTLYKCFRSKIGDKKIALNSTSLIHASSSFALGVYNYFNPNIIDLLRINSAGYFIFDFFYILTNRKFDLLRIMYIYHHICTFAYIHLPVEESYGLM